MEQSSAYETPTLVAYQIRQSGRRHYVVRVLHETRRIPKSGRGVHTSLALAIEEHQKRLVATRKHLKTETAQCREDLHGDSLVIVVYDQDGRATSRAIPRKNPPELPLPP